MKFEDFVRLIDQFDGLEELHLQGLGEPMMHPRFFDMVAYAARKGTRVSTNSNMTLLTRRRAELCVTSGLDCLHVSIDGATAETYERIRVKSRLARVVRNLDLLIATKQRLQSQTPHLRLVAVVMRQNLHELPALVRFACQWSIASSLPARYRPMREFVEAQTLINEDPKRIEHYFAQARSAAHELGIDLRLPLTRPRLHPPGTPGPERCDWPWRGAYVSYQGLAMPCCMVATPDRINFGNMVERGAAEIWSGEEYQEFRQQLDSTDPPEVCRSCAIYAGTF
jgi:radical SAM protein with 4Fe4S-binding SPASM domain